MNTDTEAAQLNLNDKGRGRFTIDAANGNSIGEMEVAVSSTDVVVYHTEVKPEHEGKGYAKKMFDAMIALARERKLQIVPLCPYVRKQLERKPDDYKDVWQPKAK